MQYYQSDVLFGKDLSMFELEKSRQEPSAREFRYLATKHRISRGLGMVTARNLQLKTSWKTEDPTLDKNPNRGVDLWQSRPLRSPARETWEVESEKYLYKMGIKFLRAWKEEVPLRKSRHENQGSKTPQILPLY